MCPVPPPNFPVDRPVTPQCTTQSAGFTAPTPSHTKFPVFQVVNSIVQEDRLGRFDVVKAGDDVDKKKPDPMIYNMAQQLVNVPPEKCVVIEDSLVGLRAAKAAGMKCIITPTASTANAVFRAALTAVPILLVMCPLPDTNRRRDNRFVRLSRGSGHRARRRQYLLPLCCSFDL